MEKQKILIVRLSSIGDVVQASGIPRHLASKFPQAQIDWVVRADNAQLISSNPYINHVFAFDRKEGFWGWIKLCKKLKENHYTHLYDAHNNIRSRILSLILWPRHLVRRSKERIQRFILFTFKLNFLEKRYKVGINTYIKPLEKWGITNDHKGSEFFLDKTILENAKKHLPTLEHLIAIAPATAWPKKTWPEMRWKQLIELLLKNTNYNILILGGPKDEFCKNLILDPKRCFSLQGKINLLENAGILFYCKTLIAADTGLLHIAEAIGKNVVCIQGPTHLGYAYRPQSVTVKQNLWCQPCSKDGSGICIRLPYQKCMVDIQAQEVLEAFNQVAK